jgi:DNA-binding transcriptional LysR family regulator
MPWQFSRGGRTIEVSPPARLRSNNAEVLLRWAADGAGIVQLPTYVVHEALRRGGVQPLLTDWRSERAAISLGTQQQRRPLPKLRAAVDFLMRWARNNPALAEA